MDKHDKEKRKILEDPRFHHLVSDPRFKHLPKHERKVKIDKRFEAMFHDEKFKVKYTVDKYGRKVNKSSTEDLKRFYDIESSDEEREDEERRQEEKEIVKDSSSEDDQNDNLEDDGVVLPDGIKEKLLDSKFDYARGEGRLLSDSSSDEESSEDDEVFIEHVWGELDNEAPKTDESTRRLAACNMDWDRIGAADIMVLCNSFLPPGGSILSVTIYPSEFGKERMAEEEIHGPPELVNKDNHDTDSDEELIKEQDSDAEEGDDYHMEKLRQYQLNRLKYYYAVIECDTVATADKLYKECDGLEYESTATKFDLRFIPDDVSFDEDQPREVCSELPNMSKYKPRLFTTTALYQAKVDLTWDETSIERKEMNEKLASGKLDDINDLELKKYVAYSSEEERGSEDKEELSSDEDERKSDKISKYKALLENINKKEEEEENRKHEMEFTWGINTDNKSEKESKKIKSNLNPFERMLEKKKEKNKRRKEERKKKNKGGGDDESDNSLDDIDMNDPYFAEEFANGEFEASKKSKRKGKKLQNKQNDNDSEEERKAKELELLLEDDDNDKEHFSLSKIQKTEDETKSKRKRKKQLKKSKQEIEASKAKVEDNFDVNVNDQRFSALFKSHLFNIDPTDPHFKKTKGMEKIIHEKFKRREDKKSEGEQDNEESVEKCPRNNLENRLLVKNLKRKIQAKSNQR